MDTLVYLTEALFNKGLDYEVTLKGSKTTVRLFDSLTLGTIGISEKNSLEEALASILATVADGAPQMSGYVPFDGLSRL